MASALGRLPNAPLIYVLSQIVFTRVPNMESRWENFHEVIFDRYPKLFTEEVREVQFLDSNNSTQTSTKRWHFLSNEISEGVILSSEIMIFHSASYVTSIDFFNKLEAILAELADFLPDNIEVSRLGLRYVDLLLPSTDLNVDQQVSGKLGSISLDDADCEFLRLEEVTSYKTPQNGNLIIRHRQSKNKDILPGDLFPNNLKHAERFEKDVPENAVVGLLDYDHYVQVQTELNVDTIINKFKDLHITSSTAFKLTTTKKAKQLWGDKSQ